MMKILRYCLCAFIILLSEGKLHAQCNADFNYNINLNTVNCYPKDSIANAVYLWFVGDDTSNNYQGYDFNYTVPTPGTYKVTLIVNDSINNCSDIITKSIDINFTPTCVADFYAVWQNIPGNQFFNQYVIFSNSKTIGSTITNYLWTIDGADIDTNSELLYTFPQAGLHTVCLKIKTASGCTADTCKPVMAFNNCHDTISFTHQLDSMWQRTIDFTATTFLPHGAYYWYFNAPPFYNSGATGFGTQQQFPSVGNYNVTLMQVDSVKHCFDSTSQVVTLAPSPCDSFTQLDFWYDAVNDAQLQTIHFHCPDSVDAQHWNFMSEDSSFYATLDANNPVYTFPHPGYYHTCLHVSHTNGCTQERCFWIYDSLNQTGCDSTTLSFNYYQNANNSKQFNFNAVSNKSIASESWYIAKGGNPFDTATIDSFNPLYNFADTGVYYINLKAFFDSSCTKYYTNWIFISDTTVNFTDSNSTSNNLISSYPNPANDRVTMNVQLNVPATVHINIYNLNGQNVYSSQVGCIKGANTITIPVQNLPRGQYFIDINNNGQRKRSIFQKF